MVAREVLSALRPNSCEQRDESWASSPAVRKSMQGNRSKDTQPELLVRRLVHAQGLRYRVSARPEPSLRRTADLVFTRVRVAVFIDGCFWHGCPVHHTIAKSNAEYWRLKVRRNVERDAETSKLLEDAGWKVLRFWEHDAPIATAQSICLEVDVRRAWLNSPHEPQE
jgi:DNA mismatch endonuclease (patch repair protein)